MKRILAGPLALAAGLGVVLTGCSSSSSTASASGSASASASARPTASGQSMSGMDMSGASPAPSASASTPSAAAAAGTAATPDPAEPAAAPVKPTDTQTLVCGDEIQGTVKQVLKLKTLPTPHSSYAAGLYTCVYDLPMGPMRLSVQHSATDAAARTYLTMHSNALHANTTVAGLGEGAFGTGAGIVVTIKDNETLTVDTTALPKTFGTEGQKSSDLAYEIASDVLGCWTGDDS